MSAKLKIEIVEGENILEIYENEPGKLTLVMYRDDPKDNAVLDITIDTSEFTALLKRLIDYQ